MNGNDDPDNDALVFIGGSRAKKIGMNNYLGMVTFVVAVNIIILIISREKYLLPGVMIPMWGFSAFILVIAFVYKRGARKMEADPPSITIDKNNISVKHFFFDATQTKTVLKIRRSDIKDVIPNNGWRLAEEVVKKYKNNEIKIYDGDNLRSGAGNPNDVLFRIVNRSFIIVDKNDVHYLISMDFQELDRIVDIIKPTQT